MRSVHVFYCQLDPRAPVSALFPYTTLFRSSRGYAREDECGVRSGHVDERQADSAGSAPVRPCLELLSGAAARPDNIDRKSTRLNSSHTVISYADLCLQKNCRAELLRRIGDR